MDVYFYLIIIWWLLLGVLLMALGSMVGMDMGVGTILRYVGRTDAERRVALNIIGPHWDGNQVWFVLGGGAIFAAWPLVYATSFSGLDRKSTRLNSSHVAISYAVFCLKKKTNPSVG